MRMTVTVPFYPPLPLLLARRPAAVCGAALLSAAQPAAAERERIGQDTDRLDECCFIVRTHWAGQWRSSSHERRLDLDRDGRTAVVHAPACPLSH